MIKAKPNPAAVVDKLIDLAGHTEIIKHVPGRIELKIKASGILLALNLNLLEVKASIQGILDADANTSARSVTILYDEKRIPKELWDLLIKARANPKIQQLVRKELVKRLTG